MEKKKAIQLNTIDLGGGTTKGCNCEASDLSAYAKKEDVPKKVSELENDSGFITKNEIVGGWQFVKTLVDFSTMDVTEYSDYDNFMYYLDENGNEYPRTLVYWNDNGSAYLGNTPIFYDADTMNPMCVEGWEKEAYPPFCSNKGAISISGRSNLTDTDGNSVVIERGGPINTNLCPFLWVKSANGKRLTGRIDLCVKK